MKILVNEMPKEVKECRFAVRVDYKPIQAFVCMFNSPCFLEAVGDCPYLKECKHIEDDGK